MHWGDGGYGWMDHGLGAIPMILMWIVVVVAVVLLVRWMTRGGAGGADRPQSNSAIEILEQRYARGEISREEFIAMKKDLGG